MIGPAQVCTWSCKKWPYSLVIIYDRTIFGPKESLDLMTPIRWPHVPLQIATKFNSRQDALWVDGILWLSPIVNLSEHIKYSLHTGLGHKGFQNDKPHDKQKNVLMRLGHRDHADVLLLLKLYSIWKVQPKWKFGNHLVTFMSF